MPLYMYQAGDTAESVASLLEEPRDRITSVAKAFEDMGAEILVGGYPLGEYDVLVVYTAPDDATAAALALAIAAGGAARSAKTTRLLTGEEWVSSLRKASGSRPGGRSSRMIISTVRSTGRRRAVAAERRMRVSAAPRSMSKTSSGSTAGSTLPGGAARRMSWNWGRADTRRYSSGGRGRLAVWWCASRPAAAARAAGAAWAGGATLAAYGATKAFDLILAESLWAEWRTSGVDVLGLVLGATGTPSLRRVLDAKGGSYGELADPGDVAEKALDHLADGPTWICGSGNPAGASPLGALSRRDAVLAMSRGASASSQDKARH